jgi:predicted nucleic acid-binding Zn ribbon protein
MKRATGLSLCKQKSPFQKAKEHWKKVIATAPLSQSSQTPRNPNVKGFDPYINKEAKK